MFTNYNFLDSFITIIILVVIVVVVVAAAVTKIQDKKLESRKYYIKKKH